MIEEMTIRNLWRSTRQSYIYAVAKFSRHSIVHRIVSAWRMSVPTNGFWFTRSTDGHTPTGIHRMTGSSGHKIDARDGHLQARNLAASGQMARRPKSARRGADALIFSSPEMHLSRGFRWYA